jgi:hypothetical protein
MSGESEKTLRGAFEEAQVRSIAMYFLAVTNISLTSSTEKCALHIIH